MARSNKTTGSRSARSGGKAKGKSQARSKSEKKAKKPKAKNQARKSNSTKRKSRSSAKKKKTAGRSASVTRSVSFRASAGLTEEGLESVPLSSDTSLLEALQKKLDAIEALRDHLLEVIARDGSSLQTDTALDSLNNAENRVAARIAAAATPTLPPPGAAKVTALVEAIRGAEEVIRKNKAVNELIAAANKLLDTLQD